MSVRTRRRRDGSETSISVRADFAGWWRDPARRRRQRLDPVAAAREHEQPVAVQEQLVAPGRVERERVEEARLRRPETSTACRLPFADREERLAVRLDEVGLVDALLLHVRAREVDALWARRAARAARGAAATAVSSRPPPSPYGPTKRLACDFA